MFHSLKQITVQGSVGKGRRGSLDLLLNVCVGKQFSFFDLFYVLNVSPDLLPSHFPSFFKDFSIVKN